MLGRLQIPPAVHRYPFAATGQILSVVATNCRRLLANRCDLIGNRIQ